MKKLTRALFTLGFAIIAAGLLVGQTASAQTDPPEDTSGRVVEPGAEDKTATSEDLTRLSNEQSQYVDELDVAIDAALAERARLGIAPGDEQLTDGQAEKVEAAMKAALADNRARTARIGWPYGLNGAEIRLCGRYPRNCYQGKQAANQSFSSAANRYPRFDGVNDRRDAYRHAFWMANTANRTSNDFAYRLGNAHEADEADTAATRMDYFNNGQGRDVTRDNPSAGTWELADRCQWRERQEILRIRP